MLYVPCPHCGSRAEIEFVCAGEAMTRPDPASLSDADWASAIFTRTNARGPLRERWFHAAGCRRWFEVTRDTRTNRFVTPEGG